MNQSVVGLIFACYCTLDIAMATPPAPPAQISQYRLVFFDEFNELDLGTSQDGTSAQSHKWYEGVWFNKYHAPREDFSTANSALSVRWKRGQLQSDSSISTFSRRHPPDYHAWRYGYFEARMKWPPQEGAWPAFWLIPVQPAFSDWPMESGEIDIFEGQGSEPHTFFGTIHRWSGQKQLASSPPHNHFPLPPNTDFSQFHTYGLLWVPGRVTWYFDDVPLHSESTYDIFDRQDFFLVLAMQEGSDWKGGDLTGVAAQTLTLTVDWVRVWQLHSK